MSDTTISPADPPPGRPWPRCGASAIVFRGPEVLLVQRGTGALAGLWSPPGGHIEPGEPASEAAAREVREETAVEARIGSLVDLHEVMLRNESGAVTAHYLIAVYLGTWVAGEPAPASDAAAARFVPVAEVGTLPLTPRAAELIDRAWRLHRLGSS